MPKNYTLKEQQILERMGIENWRQMSSDKIVEFASSMPYLDPEVAKAAIAQFPNFSDMAKDIVSTLKDSLDSIDAQNAKSSEQAYAANMQILNDLSARLNKRFLLPGERKRIIEAMVQVSNNIVELEKANKHFLSKSIQAVTGACVATVGLAVAILGLSFRKR